MTSPVTTTERSAYVPPSENPAWWDRAAPNFDNRQGRGRLTGLERQVWLQQLARVLPTDRPLRVLDVGTGTGFLALMIAELGHVVTGVDYALDMLEVARRNAEERGLSVTFVQGDARDLQLAPASFDALVCRNVLWTLMEPERVVRGWARLVVPGGTVAAFDADWGHNRARDQWALWAGRLLRTVRTRKRTPPLPRFVPELPLRHVDDYVPAMNTFARAGLVNVRGEMLTQIDRVERAHMTFAQRLEMRWRHYLVEGTVSAG